MKPEIELMIDLQNAWDEVLKIRGEIGRHKKSISFWMDNLKTSKNELNALNETIKITKSKIKDKELELNEKELKISKLVKRKNAVTNEKELTAVTHELDSFQKEKSVIEEDVLTVMGNLDELEKRHISLNSAVAEKEIQVERDTTTLTAGIESLKKKLGERELYFNTSLAGISPQVKSKFLKLIQSKEGKAIAEIKNDICTFCNFKIPSFLASEALKGDSFSVCTNCGRYIFARK